MSISIKNVEHVAKLARLELSEDDKKKFTSQLESILNYIDKLSELEIPKNCEQTIEKEAENVLRADEVIKSIDFEVLKKNAPDVDGRFFKVKKVIE